MTGRGLRNPVVLVRIGEPCAAFRQPREPTGELVSESAQVVTTETVDRDHHDQSRLLACGLGLGGSREKRDGGQGTKAFQHAPIWSFARAKTTYGANKRSERLLTADQVRRA